MLEPTIEPDYTRVIYSNRDKNRYISESATTFPAHCRELFAREDIKELISRPIAQ